MFVSLSLLVLHQQVQCCMKEGDVCLCLHSIPHAGTRNDGEEVRQNLIWRLRAKSRQPSYVHEGTTDHPDRSSWDPIAKVACNGAWLDLPQDKDEPPYFPGERSNDAFERSKYALTHMWHEFPGMAATVAEMRAREAGSGEYPRGAGPAAVSEFKATASALDSQSPVPTTPREAREYWAAYEAKHGKPEWYLAAAAAAAGIKKRVGPAAAERRRQSQEDAKL